MARFRLKYVDEFPDRYGVVRRYFRRPKGKRIPLPGEPGSREFHEAYQAALEATSGPVEPKRRERGDPGTFDRLAGEYFASSDYMRLGRDTRRAYRGVIERFTTIHGKRLVRQMKREHIKRILAGMVDRPGAATELLKKLRILIRFAIDLGWIETDPTTGIKKFKGGEFHSWTEAEIAQFEAAYAIGTRERTAFALHLYTGQRRSDVVKMGWPDVSAGTVQVVASEGFDVAQKKTAEKLWIPIHPSLAAVLEAWPKKHVTILCTSFGRPFSAAGYGNWFRDAVVAAGLPDRCSSHGLRKAAGRRLAEAGCSEKEIAAILGHKTLQEVARYTRAADQRRLATAAITRLSEQKRDT